MRSEARCRLSSAQQGILIDQLSKPDTAVYNIGMAAALDGDLDVAALGEAIASVSRVHEALRIVLRKDTECFWQCVLEEPDIPLDILDLSSAADPEADAWRYVDSSVRARFELFDRLLWSSTLIRVGRRRFLWMFRFHHVVCDGYGATIFFNSVARAYSDRLKGIDGTGAADGSFIRFIEDDLVYLGSDRFAQDGRFWSDRLAGAANAPLARPRERRSERLHSPSGTVMWMLPYADHARMDAYARARGSSVAQFMAALLAIYIHRTTGSEQVVIGVPVHNRSKPWMRRTIGMFSSVIPLAVNVDPSATMETLIRDVDHELRSGYRHRRYPVAQMKRDLGLQHASQEPLFDVTLSVVESRTDEPMGDMRCAVSAHDNGTSQGPLVIWVKNFHQGREVAIELNYDTDSFDRAEVEKIRDALRALLDSILEGATGTVGQLPLLDQAQRQRVVGTFNDTARPYPASKLIHEVFEARVASDPEAVAIVSEDEQVTYGELNRRANRVARGLSRRAIPPRSLVALVLPRGLQMIIFQLAVLKIRCAYVPVDPAAPAARRQAIFASFGGPLVVYDGDRSLDQAEASCAMGVNASSLLDDGHDDGDGDPVFEDPCDPAMLPACVMYTSGSTGVPKGVVVPHRGVVRLAVNNGYADIGPTDKVAHVSNPAFDAAAFEVWGGLLNGAELVVLSTSQALDHRALGSAIAERGISVLLLTTALFNHHVSQSPRMFSRLRYLLFGGEACDVGKVRTLVRSARPQNLVNAYGPTEGSTIATCYRIEAVDDEEVILPIGRPISNTRVYILDAARSPVAIGAVGDIYIGGDGVAIGYLNDAALTSQCFFEDPFDTAAGARMYRTGDRGRWRTDGHVEFVGRIDAQVKIRGFRVEIEEVEAGLRRHEAVRQAVVVARTGRERETELVAYVVPCGAAPAVPHIKAFLGQAFPDYMIPARFVVLDALPMTPNGKLDRDALPPPVQAAPPPLGQDRPQGEIEQAIADIWCELLQLDHVARSAQFFELGAHSLTIFRLVGRLKEQFGVTVPLPVVFRGCTVASLADEVFAAQLAGFDPDSIEAVLAEMEGRQQTRQDVRKGEPKS